MSTPRINISRKIDTIDESVNIIPPVTVTGNRNLVVIPPGSLAASLVESLTLDTSQTTMVGAWVYSRQAIL